MDGAARWWKRGTLPDAVAQPHSDSYCLPLTWTRRLHGFLAPVELVLGSTIPLFSSDRVLTKFLSALLPTRLWPFIASPPRTLRPGRPFALPTLGSGHEQGTRISPRVQFP